MSETLLAILLVTSSAKGSSLVYRWPPLPQTIPRLARPRPKHATICKHADNPWRAANLTDSIPEETLRCSERYTGSEEDDYTWRRVKPYRDRSLSFSHSRSHPTSRRGSPTKEHGDSYTLDGPRELVPPDIDYYQVLGYSAEFLANILCPTRPMCHQKFELVVDDLAFIGHPVCGDADNVWRFTPEKAKMAPRGRGSKKGQSPQGDEKCLTPEKVSKEKTISENWLQTFHLVLVLDLPDPSSSASGNISKYFDIIYEKIAFVVTAVLYQEQVLNNFVEVECDKLGALENDYVAKGEPFSNFVSQALRISSIAPAIKSLYEAIKDRGIARITINDFPLELQLPPYLDNLLHIDDLSDDDFEHDEEEEEEYGVSHGWGTGMGFAWRLPALTPWKSLLRLDDAGEQGYELYMKLRGPQLTVQDRDLAEQLIHFLDLASIHFSFYEMADELDWDLESKIFPTVRWLVLHRRAKVVDTVHSGLKTVFMVSPKLPAPLAELSAEFSRTFKHPSIPPLPRLLSMITSTSKEQTSANHFYANVVKSKDLIPVFDEVVVWLLKRDIVITLHLRIRIIAPPKLKARVRQLRQSAIDRREKRRASKIVHGRKAKPGENQPGQGQGSSQGDGQEGGSGNGGQASVPESSPVEYIVSLSPKSARRHTRQKYSADGSVVKTTITRGRSTSITVKTTENAEGKMIEKLESVVDNDEEDEEEDDDDAEEEDMAHVPDDSMKTGWDLPSMINDPGRATALERAWLNAMSEGKDPRIVKRFEQVNQYFNGKCTDDEILYRAEMSRKHLREILHHYDEYINTSLHPS
ncbi:Nitrogen permease regulator 3 [Abortiporus biennis]